MKSFLACTGSWLSSTRPCQLGVSTVPGQIAFTQICPKGEWTYLQFHLPGDEVGGEALGETDHGGLGRPIGKPLRSALGASINNPAIGTTLMEEQTEDMLMMCPPSGRSGATSWHIQNMLRTLMFQLRSKISSEHLKMLPW